MSIHNLKRGDKAFSISLRRVVKVVRVLEKHRLYEVEAAENHMGAECECCELAPLDDTPQGKRNQKIAGELERLMDSVEL